MINRYFFIFTIISYFLMVCYLKIGGVILAFYFLTGSAFLITNFAVYKDEFSSIWAKLLQTSSFRYLLRLIVWIILGILYSAITGEIGWAEVLRAFLGGFIFSIIFPYITSIFGGFKLFSYKSLLKIIFILFFCIFSYGIIQIIGKFLNIAVIDAIDSIIRNKVLVYKNFITGDTAPLFVFGIPRISSIFQEPSFLAYEIVLISPLIYLISFSKYKLFENTSFDFALKKLTYIFMIINLIFAQSPIFSVLGTIILIFLPALITIRKIKYTSQGIIRGIFILILLLLTVINVLNFGNNLDISETFLNRIVITIKNLDNYTGLITAEPSLATRLGLYVNYFLVGLKNPILGVGYGNLTHLIDCQLAVSPIPLTSELMARFTYSIQDTGGSPVIFFRFLAETGIVGVIFLYSFFFNLITSINRSISDFSGIEREFLTGLKFLLIMLILTSIYDSTLNHSMNWILIGIAQAMTIHTAQELDFYTKNEPIAAFT